MVEFYLPTLGSRGPLTRLLSSSSATVFEPFIFQLPPTKNFRDMLAVEFRDFGKNEIEWKSIDHEHRDRWTTKCTMASCDLMTAADRAVPSPTRYVIAYLWPLQPVSKVKQESQYSVIRARSPSRIDNDSMSCRCLVQNFKFKMRSYCTIELLTINW